MKVKSESEIAVVSNSLQPHGLQPTRLLSMEFSRQEYWSGLPLPSPGDLPDLGIESVSHIAGRPFNLCVTREALKYSLSENLL